MKKWTALILMLVCLCGMAGCARAEKLRSGDYEYVLLEDGTAEITGYKGKASTLKIPDKLNGKRVTAIGENAFFYCDTLVDVDIPFGVTIIGEGAFYRCESLMHVRIPESVSVIERDAFGFCTWLMDIELPAHLRVIGDHAFAICESMTRITIPNSVTEIGGNPFADCDNLTRILVSPDHPTLAVINGVLFDKVEKKLITYLCTSSASSYSIPDGIRSIGDMAFTSCKSLSNLTIPDSVTSIGCMVIAGCDSLQNLVIPDSVSSIEYDAFYGSDSLTLTVGRNSYAKEYAVENDIPYIYPDSLDWLND